MKPLRRIPSAILLLSALFLLLALPADVFGLSRKDVHAKTLSNGLTVLFVRTPGAPHMVCRLFYRAGSVHDPHRLEGLAHLVSRVTFHGTRRIGIRDILEEGSLLAELEGYQELLAREKIDPAFLEKLRFLPLAIERTERKLRTRLAALGGSGPAPMTKTEMEGLLTFVRDAEKQKEALNKELEGLRGSESYLKLETRKVILDKIASLRRQHQNLLVPEEMRRIYQRAGALQVDGAAHADCTLFSVILPVRRFETFLWIESDRMRNAVLRNLESVRMAQQNRLCLHDSKPGAAYETELRALSFLHHPYARPALGWTRSVTAIRRKDVVRFYQEHYTPSQAVLVFIGDTEPVNLMDKVAAYFEFPPRNPAALEALRPTGPPQTGMRRLEAATTGKEQIDVLFRAPALAHPDHPLTAAAVECLRSVQSPLVRLTAADGPAESLSIRYDARSLGGRLSIQACPRPGVSLSTLESALFLAIEAVRKKGFSSETLSGAVNRVLVGWGIRASDPASLAQALGEFEIAGLWTGFFALRDGVSKATLADLRRVFSTVFDTRQLTVGVLRRKRSD